MIMRDDILERAILQAETARDNTQLLKAQLLIQMQRCGIAFHHRIELQNAEPQLFRLTHAVQNQFFPDVLPARCP